MSTHADILCLEQLVEKYKNLMDELSLRPKSITVLRLMKDISWDIIPSIQKQIKILEEEL